MNLILKKVSALIMSIAILSTMLLTSVNLVFAEQEPAVCGGWFETLYAQWNDADVEKAVVFYKKTQETNYSTVDSELIRKVGENTARVDIVGISEGNYDIKIVSGDNVTFEKTNISVKPYDRTGYAHHNYAYGVGAYNNDGTPKSNAVIVYVTDENKNSVQIPGYEDCGTGIGWLLNNNTSLTERLAADGKPLIVRFIGTVTPPEGLTAYNSYENGGTPGDNGNMCIVKKSKNVTIEGIGNNAIIEGWGFSFYVGEDYKNYESYETRNLTFRNYPEDALGFQGFQSDTKTLKSPIERVWVHNNSFYPGYCENPTESDKTEGDGSCDFKRGQNYTMAYNYYYGCHKTNLVGASDSNMQYNMTFHHNYYENCGSRSPLARMANIHIYNSYFKGNTSKTVDARANSYIFSESNFYEGCKNAVKTTSGAIVKSFGDIFYDCLELNNAVIVSDKNEKIDSTCKYPNFDTSSDFYKYTATSAPEAKEECIMYSGVMKTHEDIIADKVDGTIIKETPKNNLSLPYSINFVNSAAPDYAGTKLKNAGIAQMAAGNTTELENIIYKPANKYDVKGTSFKFKDQGVTFSVDKKALVTIKSSGGSYGAVLYNKDGLILATAKNGSAYAVVDPGTYMIQSALSTKEAYVSELSVSEYDGTTPTTESTETSTEITTVDEGSSETTTSSDENQGDASDVGKGLVLDFTNNTNTADAYNVTGNMTSNYSIDYAGKTYKKGLKMESSTSVKFNIDQKSRMTLVVMSTVEEPIIKLDGTEYDMPTGGFITIDVSAGSHEIKKGTKNTFIFYIEIQSLNNGDNEPSDSVVYGDIDDNGIVDVNDALLVLQYVLNPLENNLSEKQLLVAGVMDNDYLSAADASAILQKALNSSFKFIVEIE